MSIQTEIATQGHAANGPGLAAANGLPVPGSAVNQSAGAAQVRLGSPLSTPARRPDAHHRTANTLLDNPAVSLDAYAHPQQHDPYASNYGSYHPAVVNGAYGNTYSSGMNSLTPAYYPQASQPQPQQQQQQQPHADQTPHDQNGAHLHEHTQNMQEQQFPDSELRYTQQLDQQPPTQPRQGSSHGRSLSSPNTSPPPAATPGAGPSTANGNGTGSKRKDKAAGSGDEGAPPPKKRRAARPSLNKGDGADGGDDEDVGPGGGAKHWTVEEKTRLFSWILEDDERWEQFGSKMNVIFREGSEKLYSSRKSFTALKSCYHRNFDVFKQIYLFEAFLTRAPNASSRAASPGTPSSSASAREVGDLLHAPIPASFDTPQERQAWLEKKLDAARALEIPIANLNVKVIDNWHERGWYPMFKRRFKDDPKTGLPVPSHDSVGTGWSMIPPPLPKAPRDEDHTNGDAEHDADDKDSLQTPRHASGQLNGAGPSDGQRRDSLVAQPLPHTPKTVMSRVPVVSTTPHRTPQSPSTQPYMGAPSTSHAPPSFVTGAPPPPPQYAQASPQLAAAYAYPASASTSAPAPFYPSPPSEYQPPPLSAAAAAQGQGPTLQALAHLTQLTQTLLGTCTQLTELVRTQVEDGKVRTELLRRREERERERGGGSVDGDGVNGNGNGEGKELEALGRTQKASLAMELLSNAGVGNEVKNVAADYLKKLFQ